MRSQQMSAFVVFAGIGSLLGDGTEFGRREGASVLHKRGRLNKAAGAVQIPRGFVEDVFFAAAKQASPAKGDDRE